MCGPMCGLCADDRGRHARPYDQYAAWHDSVGVLLELLAAIYLGRHRERQP